MKKTKLLIPALTIAAAGSVVAPMMTMTSCGNKVVASTDDVEFTGDQHKAVTGGWTTAEANTDYFKDEKHLINDALYAMAFMAKYELSRYKDVSSYTNPKITAFHAEMSNFSWSDKEAKINYNNVPNKGKIKGKLFTCKIVGSYTISYDDILNTHEKTLYKKIHHQEKTDIIFNVKDGFAFIGKNLLYQDLATSNYKNGFSLNIFGAEDASNNWSIQQTTHYVEKVEYTGKNDEVVVETESTDKDATYTCAVDKNRPLYSLDEGAEEISYLPSSYLSKVEFKNEDMPMGYRDDVYTTESTEPKLGYYASPILLTPGQEYTFFADIKEDDKINLLSVAGNAGSLLAIKSATFKLDSTAQTDWRYDPTNKVFTKDANSPAGRLAITVTLADDEGTDPVVAIPNFTHFDLP